MSAAERPEPACSRCGLPFGMHTHAYERATDTQHIGYAQPAADLPVDLRVLEDEPVMDAILRKLTHASGPISGALAIEVINWLARREMHRRSPVADLPLEGTPTELPVTPELVVGENSNLPEYTDSLPDIIEQQRKRGTAPLENSELRAELKALLIEYEQASYNMAFNGGRPVDAARLRIIELFASLQQQVKDAEEVLEDYQLTMNQAVENSDKLRAEISRLRQQFYELQQMAGDEVLDLKAEISRLRVERLTPEEAGRLFVFLKGYGWDDGAEALAKLALASQRVG